jgi:hypothetical protein
MTDRAATATAAGEPSDEQKTLADVTGQEYRWGFITDIENRDGAEGPVRGRGPSSRPRRASPRGCSSGG